jgi:hypothetical protein
MPNGRYEVAGLVPASSDLTPDRAAQHFSSLRFSQYHQGQPLYLNEPVRAEPLSDQGEAEPTGFRVWYGTWSVTAWLDSGPDVLDYSHYLSEQPDLPAPPEVIAGCTCRLDVSSDPDDPDFDNSDRFTEYTDQLRERFGVFIRDHVNGRWW